MGQLQRVFEYEGQTVRAVVIDGNPYVVAVDVARSLGYKNPHAAVRQHCKGCVKHAVPNLFEIKEFARGDFAGTQTLITPKGREIFRLLLKEALA